MLSKELQKRLVALYLNSYATAIKAEATGQNFSGTDKEVTGASVIFDQCASGHLEWEAAKDRVSKHAGASARQIREERLQTAENFVKEYKSQLADKDPLIAMFTVSRVAEVLKKKLNINMTEADRRALAIELTNADKQIYEIESARLRGEWAPLELMEEKVKRELGQPYYDMRTVLESYQEHYIASKPNVSPGTIADMEVECRVLHEIVGNISIAEFNSMETVAKLKSVLRKYPQNKLQRYGDRSIHSIIRGEKGYTLISLKTANEYIKRAKAVVAYANKAKMLSAFNVYEGELFQTEVAAEEQRPAYDNEDIARLIDAICTQPLWRYKPAKPERFWLILIALFHGLRLGNIVTLTKADICQTDKGMWVFRLRKGKTKATVRPVAICDSLLLLGFLEWVESLDRVKLFQDTANSFSKWYNRTEAEHAGFETKYVTDDRGKCLYSLRHSFAGNVFDVTEDFKITSDMLGHSTGKSVTARYTKHTKAAALKEVSDKMQLPACVDLDKLEQRVKELFGCILS